MVNEKVSRGSDTDITLCARRTVTQMHDNSIELKHKILRDKEILFALYHVNELLFWFKTSISKSYYHLLMEPSAPLFLSGYFCANFLLQFSLIKEIHQNFPEHHYDFFLRHFF